MEVTDSQTLCSPLFFTMSQITHDNRESEISHRLTDEMEPASRLQHKIDLTVWQTYIYFYRQSSCL